MVMAVFIIVVQLVHVQVLKHGFYKAWLRAQEDIQKFWAVRADPPRGAIRDRNGCILAGNVLGYKVEAAPLSVGGERAAAEIAEVLGPLLHMPPGHLAQLLVVNETCVQLAALVPRDVGEEVTRLGLAGITARPVWQRAYPEGALASHALGFCCLEGEGEPGESRGYYGIEGFYDGLLRAAPGEPTGDLNPWIVAPAVLPRAGTDLVLTLDRTVQALVEEELARSLAEFQAQSGTIIVMDPRTFGILAMTSLPSYDPGSYLELVNESSPPFEDPAVSQQYEPGSVLKVLTLAAALDAGVVTPETTYLDEGRIEVGGRTIHNASREAYGQQTVSEILIKSLNVGSAWLSMQMERDTFYHYLQAFGLGRSTGVDLSGEVDGQLWLPDDIEEWHDSNLGTNSFGQGLAATPLQVIVATATVANDGTRLRPHIVDRHVAFDGTVSVFQPIAEAQVISPETARTVADIMVRVVEEGVPQSRVMGYRVAGKTGTAQIPIAGGYDPEGSIVSFVGFGPVPDPQFVLLVKLDRPQTSPWASQTSALSFQRIAQRLFVILGIPPENVVVAEAR
jgi:cell division protein FtsI/penicillin-binding protein 2